MSKTIISVESVKSVDSHPNADRLDVIQVLGFQVITQRGNLRVNDTVVYFPPDILIPPDTSGRFGVTNYLKHAVFPGDLEKSQCRVGATRLRGVPSYGFCVSIENSGLPSSTAIGTNVTDMFQAHKYVAPIRMGAGDAECELDGFHKYTNIENYQRYPGAFRLDESVVVTEKLHGTNCRLGLVCEKTGDFVFCAGSHSVRRKQGTGLYWKFMSEPVMSLLLDLCKDHSNDVVLFCEIFGPGVQDLDYGLTEKSMRVFDISVNGIYMSANDMLSACNTHGLLTVPLLFCGEFCPDIVEEFTYGDTTFDGVRGKFKGREGCVIRPTTEQFSDIIGGRLILKSVSADYRDRRGATDVGE